MESHCRLKILWSKGKKVMPVENINKNPQSVTGISPMQKEFLHSHKLQDPSQRNWQN